MTTIGFIGLGIMGKPMAGHLIRGGYPVYLNSRSGIPAELTVPGGLACPTPRAVAEQADIIILMLPDTPDVEKVLFAENGVAQGLSANPPRSKIIIDMSTISPIRTRDSLHESGSSATSTRMPRYQVEILVHRMPPSRSWSGQPRQFLRKSSRYWR